MTLVKLFNELKSQHIFLWVSREGQLGYSFDKEIGFPEEMKQLVIQYKEELIELLSNNQIQSEEQAKRTPYLALGKDHWPRTLSSIQQGMYLQSQIDHLPYTYTIPLFIAFQDLNAVRMHQAIHAFLMRHPIFCQGVSENLEWHALPVSDFGCPVREIAASEVSEYKDRLAKTVFPLSTGQYTCFELLHITETNQWILACIHHHMFSDAYSVPVIADELAHAYEDVEVYMQASPQPGYFDYSAYEQEKEVDPVEHKFRAQLISQLNDADVPQLRKQYSTKAQNHAKHLTADLSEAEYDALVSLCGQHNLTLYPLLFTHFIRAISVYTGQKSSFPVGLTVANRPESFQRAIGPFISTLPVVPSIDLSKSVLWNAKGLHQQLIQYQAMNGLNLQQLVHDIEGGAPRLNELLQVLFTLHNFDDYSSDGVQTQYDIQPYTDLTEKFGVSLIAAVKSSSLSFTLTYASDIYESEQIEAIFHRFVDSLRQSDSHVWQAPLRQLFAVSEQVTSDLLDRWNNTDSAFSDQTHVAAILENQVEKTPDHLALIDEDIRFTYRALNSRANQLAHYLRDAGVKRGDFVALCLDRSAETVMSIWAVLKLGAAYIPVEPDFPQDRIEYILKDSQASALIIHRQYALGLHDFSHQMVIIDETETEQKISQQSMENLCIEVSPDDLAYVIYTSGTTGKPKGVMCEHRGLINRIEWMNKAYPLAENDRVLQKTPYVFDVSVWELLWANWYGAAIVMAKPGGHKDAEYLIDTIEKEEISVIHFVPSMLNAFSQSLSTYNPKDVNLSGLKYMFCSGEALHLSHVKEIKQLLPHVQLHNLYGPTEASIDVLYFDCNDPELSKVLIGKPIDNIKIYVLDDALNILPVGAVGELHLAGVGLARGYLNNVSLTNEKFVDNPYQSEADQRSGRNSKLYKTGDLVYQQSDGSVVYLGRNDFQVKIRGFRIELEEIAACLKLHPLISRAAVQVVQDNHPWLAGYIVADQSCSDAMIQAYLSEALPEYMIPEVYVRLPSLPVTINGKLDLKALPIPVRQVSDVIDEPENELEAHIRAIVAHLLGYKESQLGCTSNLYQMGLDSIMAIRLVSQIRQAALLEISVKDVFALKNIRAICRLADQKVTQTAYQSEEGILEGEATLLPVQSWFLTREFHQPSHWNQAFCIDVPLLDQRILENALNALVGHHDALRLHLDLNHGDQQPRQRYKPVQPVHLITVSLSEQTSAQELHDSMTAWQSQFDLTEGPLYQFVYIEGLQPDRAKLFCSFHHLIMDSVSWGIIVEDLQALYEGRKLAQKRTSYRQWAACMAQYPQNHADELVYWQGIMESYAEPDFSHFMETEFTAHQVRFSEGVTRHLLGRCNQAFNTQIDDILITAADIALKRVTNNAVTHMTLEGHGREWIDDALDIDRSVGWFTSLAPYRLQSTADLKQSFIGCKEQRRKMPSKGVGYGAWALQEGLPFPPVCFNYLGQLDTPVQDDSVHSVHWRLSVSETGETIGNRQDWPFSVTIFGYVVDGQLSVEVKSCLGEAFNQALLNHYESALKDLMELCDQQSTPVYTASDFSHIQSEADLAQLPLLPQPDESQDFAMTEIQKAYLLGRLGQYEIGNVSNHIYNEYVYTSLNVERLASAMNTLIQVCPVLRTVFDESTLRQRYLPADAIEPYQVRVNELNPARQESELMSVRERLSHTVYDVSRFPLFQFEVSRLKDRDILHVSMDLILLDVQSRLKLFTLLDKLYKGEDITSELPDVTFKDYQDYTENLPHTRWYEHDKAYWFEKLKTLPFRPNLPLKTDPMRVDHPTFSEHTLYVESDIWQQFKQKAQAYHVSYSSVLLALYGYLIARYSGSDQFLITLTLFNRYPVCPSVDEILGDFTSTNLFHFQDAGSQILETIRQTHDRMWDDVNHALYNGLNVQRELVKQHQLDANAAVSPIVFTGVVGQQTDHWEKQRFLDETEIREERYWCAQTSQAWIDLQAVESGDRFMSKWLYVDQLFAPDFIPHLNQCYCDLIRYLATHEWDQGLLPAYLTTVDQESIHATNEATQASSEFTLPGLFEQQAERHGNRTAVYDEQSAEYYSYAQLQQDSDYLAVQCAEMDGDLIAVLAEKGYSQLCACLAVMKAGKGYLPLHVDWPEARMKGVLEQAGVSQLLVSQLQQQRDLTLLGSVSQCCIESVLSQSERVSVPLPQVQPDDVAYVIFTSGSTGKPKGVTISHRGAVNTILAVNTEYQVNSDDAIFALSELSFDLSVYDMFGALAAGAKIVFPDQNHVKSPDSWLGLLNQEQVTLWNTVPQLAGLLEEAAEATKTEVPSLRLFMMSGDWIPLNLIDKLAQTFPNAAQVSLGGATEGSIWSIWYPIESRHPDWTSVPYGKAMPNQAMHVLDQQLQQCPVGVTGEIFIGGVGVAMNYWRNDVLTTERFIEHPMLGRLYKTGDLGRVEQDGNIIFQGRNDFQVKVRGHRVELGEIESVIAQFEGVEQALVLTQGAGNDASTTYLAGYYVAKSSIDEQALRQLLSDKLPEYMVPRFLIGLEALPLTVNGKLDRSALPVPHTVSKPTCVLARNSVELQLSRLWSGILNLPEDQLSVEDDIFSLGCDSVMAIQIVGRIRREMQIEIGLRELFTHRSVAALANYISESQAEVGQPEEATSLQELTGDVPLLPIQQWFFTHDWAEINHWNQTAMIVTPALSYERLQQAVDRVIAYHDAFALRFHANPQGDWQQRYQSKPPVSPYCHYLHISELVVDESHAQFKDYLTSRLAVYQQQIDLSQGPLGVLIYLDGFKDGQGRIFMAWHHLIMDTVSQSVLVDDLYHAYQGAVLGKKALSYREWSVSVQEIQVSDELTSFWEKQLPQGERTVLAELGGGKKTTHTIALNADVTHALIEKLKPYGLQVQDSLASVLSEYLQQLTGQPTHSVWLEGHGRQSIDGAQDVFRTLGWFTTRYPVRFTTNSDARAQLIQTKNLLRYCADHSLAFGVAFPTPCTTQDGVSLNYLGRVDSQQGSEWQLDIQFSALSSHPENPAEHLLDVVSWMTDGQLVILVKTHLASQTAAQVAASLVAQLSALIDDLPDENRTWLTAADVDYVIDQHYLDQLQQHQEIEAVFLANSLQQGMIHHSLMFGEQDSAYRIAVRWDYHAEVDHERLHASWLVLQQQMSCLRSRFDWRGEIVQVIDKMGSFSWCYHDFSEMDNIEQQHALGEIQQQDKAHPYDLQSSGLFRVCLIRLAKEHYCCLLNVHHAILDGWSSPLLMSSLHEIYATLEQGQTPAPYLDTFPAVQRYMQQHQRDDQIYWESYLDDVEEVQLLTSLMNAHLAKSEFRSHRQVRDMRRHRLCFDQAQLNIMTESAQMHGLTLNSLFLYAWHKWLALYSGASKTVVGTVIAGRILPVSGIENAIGMFLNTLPVKHDHQQAGSFLSQIKSLQDAVNEANHRGLVNLSELQKHGNRLFDALYIFENYPAPALRNDEWLEHEFVSREEHRDYPLALQIEVSNTSLDLYLDFAGEWFCSEKMASALEVLKAILLQVSDNPHVEHLEFPSMVLEGKPMRNMIPQMPAERISDAVLWHASLQPNTPAVRQGSRVISYAQLNQQISVIAYRLQTEYGILPGQRVAMLMAKETTALATMLAIGRLGAAYVPLSNDYPSERIAYILEDCQPSCLITDQEYETLLETFAVPVLQLSASTLGRMDALPPLMQPEPNPEAIAYVLYTSGTTGKPKGVEVPNHALMATLHGLWQAHFDGKASISTYSMSNMVFDIFGAEYGLPLLSGGLVTLGDYRESYIDCNAYDFIQSTPSMLEFTLGSFVQAERCVLMVGGEALPGHLLERGLKKFSKVINVYGPTETCIWSTSKTYTVETILEEMSIGTPLPGERCVILGEDTKVLPQGAPGELYISGTGVSLGYLNQRELTSQRFVTLPFSDEIWYRTGDMVRMNENGDLVYLGRQDGQLKVMGHRIEREDIEQVMLRHPAIKQATVQLRRAENAGQSEILVGYYVPENKLVERESLQAWLKSQLPSYMIPEQLIALEAMPISVNGKLNIRALPVPCYENRTESADKLNQSYLPLAQQLLEIWEKLLPGKRIGLDDKFFSLGGNSILLTRMYGLMPEKIQAQLSLIDLFRLPTISTIVKHLEHLSMPKAAQSKLPEKYSSVSISVSDIAIVGMSGRFPRSDSLDEFWAHLKAGTTFTTHYSRDDLQAHVPEDQLRHPNYVYSQNKVDGIEYFDAGFFGYTAKEARLMDPQHRIFLECVWHAFEDANCDPMAYQGDIGVFASVGQNHYESEYVLPYIGQADLADHYQVMISNQSHFLATRVAYALDLTGPAMTIQTACSSSLVAVHQACRAIQTGDCRMAIAGGISLGQLEKQGYLYQPGMIFSPDGHCRPFDVNAKGTIEGQGVGVVLLKSLAEAIEDGDQVIAVIKGTAINNDGNQKAGFTAPSEDRQADVIRKAIASAQVTPEEVSYIETHGTGTKLGDPIEVAGLSQVLSSPSSERICRLGALKGNLGHLDVAAGIAGLIKAALCIQHRTLVPTVNFAQENPALKLQARGFSVQQSTEFWPETNGLRTAGVSAFGIGGTNAHAILQEFPEQRSDEVSVIEARPYLLCLSAPDEKALKRQSEKMAEFIRDADPELLVRAGYTLMQSRRRFACQRVVVGQTREAVIHDLSINKHSLRPMMDELSLVFMFPGQGSQYPGMTAALYEHEPEFRNWVDACLDLVNPMLTAALTRDDILATSSRVHETAVTHPAMFICEFALAKWLIAMGAEPAAMIGHSLGEYVAACCAGVLSLPDALKLVVKRGQLLADLPAGRMVSVRCRPDVLMPLVTRADVDIAVINEDASCVVSGSPDKVAALVKVFEQEEITWRDVQVSRAFHSAMLDPVLEEFSSLVDTVQFNSPTIPYVSNLDGHWVDAEQVCQPAYWVKHLRQTVMFEAGLSTLLKTQWLPSAVYVEVGPGKFLSGLVKRHPARNQASVIPGLAENAPYGSLMAMIGQLHNLGASIDVQRLWGLKPEHRVKLPAYAFERSRYWIDDKEKAQELCAPETVSELVYPADGDLVQLISAICCHVLGVDWVDADDDFFELGGDSLMAVQYSAKVINQFGLAVEFMHLPRLSVNAIVNAIETAILEEGADSQGSLVAMQTGNPAYPAIFLIHPIGGDIYFYRDLVKALPSEYPVYAIRSPMLTTEVQYRSLEEMANTYLEIIEPYLGGITPVLAGSSFGGIVAYEMAMRYKEKHDVSLPVAMIDSPCYGNLPESMSGLEILDYLMSFGMSDVKLDWSQYDSMDSLEEKIEYLGQVSHGTAYESILSASFLPKYLKVWECNNQLMQNYEAKGSDSHLLFFSHTEEIPGFPTDQDKFWKRLGHASFRVVPASGNHLTMNGPLNSEFLARHLSQWSQDICVEMSELSESSS